MEHKVKYTYLYIDIFEFKFIDTINSSCPFASLFCLLANKWEHVYN